MSQALIVQVLFTRDLHKTTIPTQFPSASAYEAVVLRELIAPENDLAPIALF